MEQKGFANEKKGLLCLRSRGRTGGTRIGQPAAPCFSVHEKTHLAVVLVSTVLFSWACGPKSSYRAAISLKAGEARAYEGETKELKLWVKNKGAREWNSDGLAPCFVSYHLLDGMGKTLRFDNPRTRLPRPVGPGEKVEVGVMVKAPLEEGRYLLEFDLVREGIAWFKDLGSTTLLLPFLVQKMDWPKESETPDLGYRQATAFRSSVRELETLRKLILITLEQNKTKFRGQIGTVSAFTAGGGYPQVWLRDAATIIPASKFYYPRCFLSSWLEEHLARQQEDGALFDWVDSQGQVDKNTVETDQEGSAVQAAYQVFLLVGPEWLGKEIGGQKIIDRLEKALLFVFRNRWETKLGLITGAHTADWGDVDSEDPDQRAIYVDEKTRWTVDIYDQSIAYEACLGLAAMLEAMGEKTKASSWRERASRLREATNRWLWQEDRGFYRVHRHLDSWEHAFDEGDMFAMGGNTQAILSGLADHEKATRIIRQAIERQQSFHVSTISGCLLPPYPAGFFKHPAMDEPYEYQNGGQWDWFGGRLVHAMFENGFSRLAKEKLLEIVRKNIANGGLFEWDTRDGTGRGSDYYAGSAGSLARALFEGYLGFKLEENSLVLSPRLRQDEATVRFYFPAADLFLAYDYQLDRRERKICLRTNGNFPHPGKIRLLIPREFFGVEDRATGKAQLIVYQQGKRMPILWQSINEDDYAVFDADFQSPASFLIYRKSK